MDRQNGQTQQEDGGEHGQCSNQQRLEVVLKRFQLGGSCISQ